MTPQQWANVASQAARDRDWDAHDLALARLLVPDLGTYNRAQLLEDRDRTFKHLIDVHDRLAAHDGRGRLTHAIAPLLQLPVPPASLDPSDPT